MSSTGRGPRLGGPDDFYATPAWCVRRLLERDLSDLSAYADPCAGDGAIMRAAAAFGVNGTWRAVECRATARRELESAGCGSVVIADFLELAEADRDTQAVVTNPPYSLAEEFIRHAAKIYPCARSAWLVRLGFLASEKRQSLWRDVGQPDVLVLPNRPSFTPDGKTDSADYCWIVLSHTEPKATGLFCVLDSTPASERLRGRK